jgi:hypothetical protein
MFKNIPIEKIERSNKIWATGQNIFTIIAIIFAGFWGYYVFALKDAPNLNKSFKISNSIRLNAFAENPDGKYNSYDGLCAATYNLQIKNIGVNDLYIDSVVIKLWQIENDSVALKDLEEYLDFDLLIGNGKILPQADIIFDNGNIVGYYPPDTESEQNFDFKVPITYDKAILFAHTIYGHGKSGVFTSKKIEVSGNSWKLQCVPEKKEDKKDAK